MRPFFLVIISAFMLAGCGSLSDPVEPQSTPSAPAASAPAASAPAPSASPGLVWVDGYYRKDGSYVRGHWRRSR